MWDNVHPLLLGLFDLTLGLLVVDLMATLWRLQPLGLVAVGMAQAFATWAACQETRPLTDEEREELYGRDL